jgi:hypothetical protein
MGPDDVETTPRPTQMDDYGYDTETIKVPDEGLHPSALEAQQDLRKFAAVHRVSFPHKHMLIL